jgi:protein tyrosine phosphatase
MVTLKPFPQSYWVLPGIFCAGQYPGSQYPAEHKEKLNGLLNCNIRRTISLMPVGEKNPGGQDFVPYEDVLQDMAAKRGRVVECLRAGYPDGSVPPVALMKKVLDTIDASITASEPVYLHCFGGHGRTGTVVGCYLVRHGMSGEQAIEHVVSLRQELPHNWYPYENGQADFVSNWKG